MLEAEKPQPHPITSSVPQWWTHLPLCNITYCKCQMIHNPKSFITSISHERELGILAVVKITPTGLHPYRLQYEALKQGWSRTWQTRAQGSNVAPCSAWRQIINSKVACCYINNLILYCTVQFQHWCDMSVNSSIKQCSITLHYTDLKRCHSFTRNWLKSGALGVALTT